MRKGTGESPLTYEDVIKAAEVGDEAFRSWDIVREYTFMLSRKSALFVDQICQIMNAYPKKHELHLITMNSESTLQQISNGYFSVVYNPLTGRCFVSLVENNIPLKNYLDSGGDYHVTNLEELEKFCEMAKFIGGMGDEH